jgi:hypothetical protein
MNKKKALTLIALLLLTMAAGAKTVNIHNSTPQPQPGTAPQGVVAVDLGLPSGTKWANMNVGATKPEEYGLYLSWGETVGYKKYLKLNDTYTDISLTKYNTNSRFGTVDNKTTLDLEDDAAHVIWGGSWVMPTSGEIDELLANTTSEWTTVNGIKGCKFTSKTNGNSIFLPAAGRSTSHLRKRRSPLIGDIAGTEEYQQVTGCYWSASLDGKLDGKRPFFATSLNFSEGYKNVSIELRFFQFPVRAVIRK